MHRTSSFCRYGTTAFFLLHDITNNNAVCPVPNALFACAWNSGISRKHTVEFCVRAQACWQHFGDVLLLTEVSDTKPAYELTPSLYFNNIYCTKIAKPHPNKRLTFRR